MLGVYDSHLLLGQLQLTFSGLKQVILDQIRQNGYQTVPFSMYIHNLMFVSFLIKCSETSLRCGCDFTTYHDGPVTTNTFRAETGNT